MRLSKLSESRLDTVRLTGLSLTTLLCPSVGTVSVCVVSLLPSPVLVCTVQATMFWPGLSFDNFDFDAHLEIKSSVLDLIFCPVLAAMFWPGASLDSIGACVCRDPSVLGTLILPGVCIVCTGSPGLRNIFLRSLYWLGSNTSFFFLFLSVGLLDLLGGHKNINFGATFSPILTLTAPPLPRIFYDF